MLGVLLIVACCTYCVAAMNKESWTYRQAGIVLYRDVALENWRRLSLVSYYPTINHDFKWSCDSLGRRLLTSSENEVAIKPQGGISLNHALWLSRLNKFDQDSAGLDRVDCQIALDSSYWTCRVSRRLSAMMKT